MLLKGGKEDGEWKIRNGEQGMENGKWRMRNEE